MVNVNDILYIEKQGKRISVVCKNSKAIIPVSRNKYAELKEFLEKQTKGLTIH